ncbi:unnamed protein product [Didymodactylos carnosus]|nr:unnamed protein product [Didymodactylos carnosus]CAF4503835.1 unnamed protein product [Didymodactylos carnosus]
MSPESMSPESPLSPEPPLSPRSFVDEGRWVSPKFVEQWVKKNPRVSLSDRVEQVVQGILIEGEKANSFPYANVFKRNQYKGLVYRGVLLDPHQIESYKNAVGKGSKEWLNFSSASKNRALAEIYGNTLFVINIPSKSQPIDISSVSNFPEEEEVLLPASTSFQIEKVEYDENAKKHYIYLRVLW